MGFKRLIFISPSITRDSAPGMRAFYLINALVDKGVCLQVISNSENNLWGENVELHYNKYLEIKNSTSTGLRILQEIYYSFSILFLILRTNNKSKIYFSLPPFFSFLILQFFLKNNRIILDIRDIYPEALSEAGFINKTNLSYQILEYFWKKSVSKSLKIFTATEGISKILSSHTKVPSTTFYNGFPKEIQSKSKSKFKKFTVVFHGIFGTFQNIEMLVCIINSLKDYDIRFLAIGYGKKLGLFKNITNPKFKIYPKMGNTETIKLVSRCHLGLSLRKNDLLSVNAIPVKVFEFIGLEINCIVSPISEGSRLVEMLGVGIGVENDPDKIRNIIISIYLNRKLQDQVSEPNQELQKFTREFQSNKIADNISELL